MNGPAVGRRDALLGGIAAAACGGAASGNPGPEAANPHAPFALWITVRDDWAIDVGVDWDEDCWDLLASFDVSAAPVAGGWENDLYLPEARVVRPSRQDVWREDGFEPLLKRINTEMVLAAHVGLWGEPDHGTWAWLMRDGVILRGQRPSKARPAHLLPVPSP